MLEKNIYGLKFYKFETGIAILFAIFIGICLLLLSYLLNCVGLVKNVGSRIESNLKLILECK